MPKRIFQTGWDFLPEWKADSCLSGRNSMTTSRLGPKHSCVSWIFIVNIHPDFTLSVSGAASFPRCPSWCENQQSSHYWQAEWSTSTSFAVRERDQFNLHCTLFYENAVRLMLENPVLVHVVSTLTINKKTQTLSSHWYHVCKLNDSAAFTCTTFIIIVMEYRVWL